MNVQRFRVYLHEGGDATTTDPRHADLTILPADRMRAERASTAELPPAQRGPKASSSHPNTWVLLWLWCSATRTGVTSDKFKDWSLTVLDFDKLDANGEPVAEDADPDDVDTPTVDPTTEAGATS